MGLILLFITNSALKQMFLEKNTRLTFAEKGAGQKSSKSQPESLNSILINDS